MIATLYALKTGKVQNTVPTIGFNVETVTYNGIEMHIWDVGGQDRLRPLWRQYYAGTSGIMFVVDSNDVRRLSKAKEELHYLMKEVELQYCVLAIVANKQDLPQALKKDQISKELDLDALGRDYAVFEAVAVENKGVTQAMDWLTTHMKPI